VALSPGDVVGPYTIEVLLGEGGMGQVFRARDARLERRVAIKVVRLRRLGDDSSAATARLLREARAAAALDHPNAVAIFEVGEAEGQAYVAMELVEGRSLRAFVGAGDASTSLRIRWLADVARALAAAHRRGLVHRDVKPENVMVRSDGVVKVLDFGIARRVRMSANPDDRATLEDDEDVLRFVLPEPPPSDRSAGMAATLATLTRAGTVVGTPLYMSPEQMRGEPVDARADQFSWGVMAYELLSGKKPWGKRPNLVTFTAMLSDPPRPLDGVDEHVARAIGRALAPSRGDRHATMDDIVTILDGRAPERAPAGATSSQGAGPITDLAAAGRNAPPAPRRRPWAGAAFALLGVAVAAVAAVRTTPGAPSAAAAAVQSSDPSPASSAPSHGVAITDLPLPHTNPDALAAYQKGLRAMRVGDYDEAVDALTLAVAKDADLGEAWGRLVLLGIDRRRDPSSAFANARRLGPRLSARTRGYVEALAPLVERTPGEPAEAARRFEQLGRAYPDDAEMANALELVELMRWNVGGIVAAADRAIALDPDYADSWSGKVGALELAERFDEARQVGEECFERFASLDCLVYVLRAETRQGDVAATESSARRVLAAEPGSWEGARALASVLFERGEPPAAIEASLAAARVHLGAHRAETLDGQLALLRGDFRDAIGHFEAAREKAPRSRSAQANVAISLVQTYEELGDAAGATRVAQRYAGESAAYAGSYATLQPGDESLPLLRVLVEAGSLSRAEFDRRREATIEPLLGQYVDFGRVMVWQADYAECARNEGDAREALEALPRFASEDVTPSARFVGRMHWLAGDVALALPELARASHRLVEIGYGSSPWWAFRQHLWYGEALEKSGAVGEACEQYAWVLSRWGRATPRSVTADEARRHSAALRCTHRSG
jgi:serine/threonine-protein kinase